MQNSVENGRKPAEISAKTVENEPKKADFARQKRWDKAHMRVISAKIRTGKASMFHSWCRARNLSAHQVVAAFVDMACRNELPQQTLKALIAEARSRRGCR